MSEAPVNSTPVTTETTPSVTNDPAPQRSAPEEIFDVKVNGKMIKMSKAEAINNASMAYAAKEKFQSAVEKENRIQQIMEEAHGDPIAKLLALGVPQDKLREVIDDYYFREFIEPETLNEDQKKLREYEKRVKDFEARDKKQQEEKARQEEDQLTNKERDYLQEQIISALDVSKLPRTAYFATRMAFAMRQNLLNGWEAPTDYLVSTVKKEAQENIREIFKAADVPTIIDLAGEDLVNKIRSWDLQNLRESRKMGNRPISNSESFDGEKSDGKISYEEVNRRLKKIRSQGY